MADEPLDAPFPWFGGKRHVASVVWSRLGYGVPSYVEPFFGSGAVLLGRPRWTPECNHREVVNDLDGFVANAWRAIRAAPTEVAEWADWPANESDLHARHAWLTERRDSLRARLEGDPDYFDAKIAGWWLWGLSLWIGHGFCSGAGSWVRRNCGTEAAPDWQLLHLSSEQGVQRQLLHLSGERGVTRNAPLAAWMAALSARLRRVKVCCGDWSRVVGSDAALSGHGGTTAVFLDPPYSMDERDGDIYAEDSAGLSAAVRAWCVANGARPELRIALCGYRGEGHEVLEELGWTRHDWVARGGYGNRNGDNTQRHREAVWFSPGCPAGQLTLPQESR